MVEKNVLRSSPVPKRPKNDPLPVRRRLHLTTPSHGHVQLLLARTLRMEPQKQRYVATYT